MKLFWISAILFTTPTLALDESVPTLSELTAGFQDYLDEAAKAVLQQHFSHSYVPNDQPRLKLLPRLIRHHPVNSDVASVLHWQYIRHDGEHFFMARTLREVLVWHIEQLKDANDLNLFRDHANFVSSQDNVIDALLYKQNGQLFLSILTSSHLFAYSSKGGDFVETNKDTCSFSQKLLQINGRLIIVSNGSQFLPIQKEAYLEILFPNLIAATAISFVDEEFVILGNTKSVQIYKLGNYGDPIKEFTDMDYLENIFTFWAGSEVYICIAGKYRQTFHKWISQGFYSMDTRIHEPIGFVPFQFPEWSYVTVLLGIERSGMVKTTHWENYEITGKSEFFLKGSPEPIAPISFSIHNKIFIMLKYHDDGLGLLEFSATMEPIPDPHLEHVVKIPQVVDDISKKLGKRNTILESVYKALDSRVSSVNPPNHLSALYDVKSMKFDLRRVVNDFVIHYENIDEDIRKIAKLNELISRLNHLNQKVNEMIDQIKDAVLTSGSYTFSSGTLASIEALNLVSNELYSQDLQIPEIYTGQEPIDIVLMGNLTVEKIQADLINGLRTSELLLKSGPRIIEGDVVLKSPKIMNLTVDGKVGLVPSQKLLRVPGPIEEVHLDQMIVTDDFLADQSTVPTSSTSSSTQKFSGTKHLKGKVVIKNLFAPTIDLNVVRRDVESIVKGTKTFSKPISFEGPLIIYGKVDGLKIPDDLVQPNKENVITGNKEIAWMEAGEVVVHGLVDGISTENVARASDMDAISRINFIDGIQVHGNLTILENFAGQPIEFLHPGLKHVGGTVVFQEPITVGKLVGHSHLFSDIQSDSIDVSQDEIELSNYVHFEGLLTVDQLDTTTPGSVLDPSLYLRTSGEAQTLGGTKTLWKPTVIKGNMRTDEPIDGVDVASLYRELALDREINGNLYCPDELHIYSTLIVDGLIDGVRVPEDLVLTSGAVRSLPFKNFLNGLSVISLHVVEGEIVDNIAIDRVDVLDLTERRVSLHGNEDIYRDITIGNALATSVTTSNYFEFPNVIKAHELCDIAQYKKFENVVVNSLDGILPKYLLKKNGDSLIQGPLQIEKLKVLGDLSAGLVAGVDIQKLDRGTLKKSKDRQVVHGTVIFEHGLDVKGNVDATSINGDADPLHHVLNFDEEQIILGHLIVDNLEVRFGNMTVDNIYLEEFVQSLAMKDQPVTIRGDLAVTNELKVTKSLETLDGPMFPRDCLPLSGTIPGITTIEGPINIEGDLNFTYVNDVPWIPEDIVLTNDTLIVEVPLVFNRLLVESGLEVSGSVTVGGLVDGENLIQLAQEVIWLDRPITVPGSLTIMSPSRISGSLEGEVNSYNLATDFLRTNGSTLQNITGDMVVDILRVEADVTSPTLNGLCLDLMIKDSLTVDGDHSFLGNVTILGTTHFKNDLLSPNTEEFLMLDKDEEILGHLNFTDTVEVRGDLQLKGTINDENLHSLDQHYLFCNRSQMIDIPMSFDHVVALDDIHAEIPRMTSLARKADKFHNYMENSTHFLTDQAESLVSHLNHLAASVQARGPHVDKVIALMRHMQQDPDWLDVTPSGHLLIHTQDTLVVLNSDGTLLHTMPSVLPPVRGSHGQHVVLEQGIVEVNGLELAVQGGQIVWAAWFEARLAILTSEGLCMVFFFDVGREQVEHTAAIEVGTSTRAIEIYQEAGAIFLLAAREKDLTCDDSALYILDQSWQETQRLPAATSVTTYIQAGSRYVVLGDGRQLTLMRHASRGLIQIATSRFQGVRRLSAFRHGLVAAAGEDQVRLYVARGENGLAQRAEVPADSPVVDCRTLQLGFRLHLLILTSKSLTLYDILPPMLL